MIASCLDNGYMWDVVPDADRQHDLASIGVAALMELEKNA